MRNAKYICVLFLLLVSVVSCSVKTNTVFESAQRSPLTITGDVSKEVVVTDFSAFNASTIEKDDIMLPAVQLLTLIEAASPLGYNHTITFHSPDGVMASIALLEIEEDVMITWNMEVGFSLFAPSFPPQAGIRNIDYIVLSAQELLPEQASLRIIDGESDHLISYGNLFLQEGIIKPVLEGTAKKNEFTVNALTRRPIVPLLNYLETSDREGLAYFADGSQKNISLAGYFDWRGTSADYLDSDAKTRTPNVIGVWANPPEASITDIRKIVEETAGDSLVILIDGLGYTGYLEHGLSFSKDYSISPMRTVMPSISNVALAAIITGKTPDENGITERGLRELNVEDMFSTIDSVMIEGHTKLINSSISPRLNADENSNGSTDDEVFDSAMQALAEKHTLTFVHLHGFDDVSHTYGPYSLEAKEKLFEIQEYIDEMLTSFSGTTYLVSDHGQHNLSSEEKKGDHGEFRYADMCVPFITIK